MVESNEGHIRRFEHEGKTIILVGTAHVSKASVEEVRTIIDEERPDVVCIELCEPRYKALTEDSAWQDMDLMKVIKEGKTLFLLGNLALGAYQRKLGQDLGVRPGAELLAAAEQAKAVGAQIELVDRSVHVTLKRTWRNVGFFDKTRLLAMVFSSALFEPSDGEKGIGAEDIESMKDAANLSEMLVEFSREFPEVKEPLIDERDQYMISKIRESHGKKIVGVVGAAHVPGMVANIETPVDRDTLEVIPPPSLLSRSLKWIIPMIVLAAFAWGYYRKGGQSVEEMLYAWVLPNSIFAAALTAVAGGKLLTILVAFIGSPITSLNPLLPIGVFTGICETWLRKPTVTDCENMNEAFRSVKGIYQNKATRVLLVSFMSILGSAIGAWVGLSWLVSLL